MSNGELLDMVRFGWTARLQSVAQVSHKLPKYKNIAQNCPNITQIAQVLRARPTQGIAHLTIAITLPLIVSRKGWLTQPAPSPLPLFYSL